MSFASGGEYEKMVCSSPQVVKTYGKNVPDIGVGKDHGENENLFPKFTTWRQHIDGQYWFRVYTRGDDELHFSSGNVHVKQVVKYTDYKRFDAKQQAAQQQAMAQQHQMQQQASADQQQAINDCQTACQTTYDSCQQNVSQKDSSALAQGIIGIMTKNAGAVSAAAEEADSGESSTDCSSAQESCNESCQSQPEVAAAQQAAQQEAYADQMTQRNQAATANALSGAMTTNNAANHSAPTPARVVPPAAAVAQAQPQVRRASQPQTSAQTQTSAQMHTQAATPAPSPAPTKVWPVPTVQWCAQNPNSGNPNCGFTAAQNNSASGGPKYLSQLNRSSCVQEVWMAYGRAIQNNCTVPVNVAYCSVGPVNDGMNCGTFSSPVIGTVYTAYAISTINSISPGASASDPSGLSKENRMVYFACENSDGKTQAVLTGYNPPAGVCAQY